MSLVVLKLNIILKTFINSYLGTNEQQGYGCHMGTIMNPCSTPEQNSTVHKDRDSLPVYVYIMVYEFVCVCDVMWCILLVWSQVPWYFRFRHAIWAPCMYTRAYISCMYMCMYDVCVHMWEYTTRWSWYIHIHVYVCMCTSFPIGPSFGRLLISRRNSLFHTYVILRKY